MRRTNSSTAHRLAVSQAAAIPQLGRRREELSTHAWAQFSRRTLRPLFIAQWKAGLKIVRVLHGAKGFFRRYLE